MKKLFSILTVLIVAVLMLTACKGDAVAEDPSQDPAMATLQAQLDDLAAERDELQTQLEEALKTEEVTEEPEPTFTPTPEKLKYKCGTFVAQGKIYQVKKNRNGVLQRNDAGNYIKDVLGKNEVKWFGKGDRTCVYKKWTQFDGARVFKLWYNTKHLKTGEWLSHPVECCYVGWNVFKPDDALYTLPAENK